MLAVDASILFDNTDHVKDSRNAIKFIEAVRGQYCFNNPPQAMPVGDCCLDIRLLSRKMA